MRTQNVFFVVGLFFIVVNGVLYQESYACPALPYEQIPFGENKEKVMQIFQGNSQCEIQEGGEPEGVLRTDLQHDLLEGIYQSKNILGFTSKFLHPKIFRGYQVKCKCWEYVTSLRIGFFIDEKEEETLLLIEKIPNESGTDNNDIMTHYDHYSLIMDELIGNGGISTNSPYIKNVYKNSVLNSLIKKWTDNKRNVFSYLVLAESSFLPNLADDEIIGHISLFEWERYVSVAKSAFMNEQKEKKEQQKKRAGESRGEF